MSTADIRIAEVERRLKKLEEERCKLVLELEAIKDGQPVTLVPDPEPARVGREELQKYVEALLREQVEKDKQRQKQAALGGALGRNIQSQIQSQITQNQSFQQSYRRAALQQQGPLRQQAYDKYVQQRMDDYHEQIAAWRTRKEKKKNRSLLSRITKAFSL